MNSKSFVLILGIGLVVNKEETTLAQWPCDNVMIAGASGEGGLTRSTSRDSL